VAARTVTTESPEKFTLVAKPLEKAWKLSQVVRPTPALNSGD
jgi:hypothetical protein